GFAIGFDRLILALEEEGYPFPKERIDFYIIPASKKDSVIKKSIEIANHLREQGKKIDIDLTNRSLKKSMKYADSMGFEKVMIVGEKDLEEGKVTVRDMKTGEQRRIEIDF
ncbi:MAG TPA: histidine--tRNA ligase, partial [Thermoplasmatales archaeon]|nr:histidine--tRNA ligase [Thermoplasmatales archaeon]